MFNGFDSCCALPTQEAKAVAPAKGTISFVLLKFIFYTALKVRNYFEFSVLAKI
jgi:hypothetical protein